GVRPCPRAETRQPTTAARRPSVAALALKDVTPAATGMPDPTTDQRPPAVIVARAYRAVGRRAHRGRSGGWTRRLSERPTGHGAEEAGVAEAEDAAVGTDEPVAPAVWR